MRNNFIYLLLVTFCLVTSCNKEERALKGWYTTTKISTSSFNRINQAIDNHEELSRGFYATRSAFFYSDGMWSSSHNDYGPCRFLPADECYCYSWQIIDSSTMIYYVGPLWDPNRVPAGDEIIGRVNAGKHFGELVYCCHPMSYYTYTRVDNKLFVSNGDIYTVTSSGLIKDGSSITWRKYDPSKPF